MSLQIWMTKPSYIAFQMPAGGICNAALESKVLKLPLCCSHETKLKGDLILIVANY